MMGSGQAPIFGFSLGHFIAALVGQVSASLKDRTPAELLSQVLGNPPLTGETQQCQGRELPSHTGDT